MTFREVAAEAGVSVSLVQHYFGTKENLLVTTLDLHSAAMGERIGGQIAALGPEAGPLDRLRAVAGAFIPVDAETRAAMLLYHGFAAAALTDEALRTGAAFRNATNLLAYIAGQLAMTGDLAEGVDPDVEARALLALVLGLSIGVLLEQTSVSDAGAVLDAHFLRLRGPRGGRRR